MRRKRGGIRGAFQRPAGVLARDPGGGWWYDAAAFVTLTRANWTERQRVTLTKSTATLGPELERAWKAYQRGGPRKEIAATLWSDSLEGSYVRWVGRRWGVGGAYRHPLDPADARAVGVRGTVRF